MSDFTARRVMMVDTQVRPSDVTKFPIIEAMLSVPREVYVPAAKQEAAYVGENLDLGAGRVMPEARTLAKMLDALDVLPSEHVLDVACSRSPMLCWISLPRVAASGRFSCKARWAK